MLRLALGCLVLVGGCTDGEAPPFLGRDLSAVVDTDGGGGDMTDSDGLPQRACTTACNCLANEGCTNGFCAAGATAVVCCSSAMCVAGNACQQPNGSVNQCGAPDDAGVAPDAGTGNSCGTVACIPGLGSQTFCTLVCGQPATCQNQGGMNRCMP